MPRGYVVRKRNQPRVAAANIETAMKNLRHKEALAWVGDFIMSHPHASVDAIAREAARCHKNVNKPDITRIKRNLRGVVQAYVPPPAMGTAKTSREPFNPVKIKLDQKDPEANLTAAEVAAAVEATKEASVPDAKDPAWQTERTSYAHQMKSKSQRAEKEKFLYELCEKTPSAKPKEILKAIQVKFGTGFWVPEIVKALNLARAVNGMAPLEPHRAKAHEDASPNKNAALHAAIKQIAAAIKEDSTSATLTVTVTEVGDISYDLQKTRKVKHATKGKLAL